MIAVVQHLILLSCSSCCNVSQVVGQAAMQAVSKAEMVSIERQGEVGMAIQMDRLLRQLFAGSSQFGVPPPPPPAPWVSAS